MEKVLIDSSVLVEFLRDKGHPCLPSLQALIRRRQACLAAPVYGEVMQGSRKEERERIRQIFKGLPYLEMEDKDLREAGELGASLAESGQRPGLLDSLIAVLAQRHGASLFTLDRQFKIFPDLKVFDSKFEADPAG